MVSENPHVLLLLGEKHPRGCGSAANSVLCEPPRAGMQFRACTKGCWPIPWVRRILQSQSWTEGCQQGEMGQERGAARQASSKEREDGGECRQEPPQPLCPMGSITAPHNPSASSSREFVLHSREMFRELGSQHTKPLGNLAPLLQVTS